MTKLVSTLDWDEPLSEHLIEEWSRWRFSIPEVENLRIPRVMVPNLIDTTHKNRLIFCDASEDVAVCYRHLMYGNGPTAT